MISTLINASSGKLLAAIQIIQRTVEESPVAVSSTHIGPKTCDCYPNFTDDIMFGVPVG